jgi:geranylgeranylglycerol-phosphate geranylgeranyltransferase
MAFVRLIRPINATMMGLAVLVSVFVATGTVFPLPPSLLGVLTSLTLSGTSNVTNDYFDRHVDAVNAPSRPLPSGVISTTEALLLASFLGVIGLISALSTNLLCAVIASASLIIALLYNAKGKETGLVGNLMVSALVALPLVYGGFIRGDAITLDRLSLPLVFASMAFLANTGREVTKGIMDMEGDRLRSVKTVALQSGARTAAITASLFNCSAVALSLFPPLLGWTSWPYLPLVAVADLGFLASSYHLVKDHTKGNARKIKNQALLWMLLGLSAFVAGAPVANTGGWLE